MAIKSKKSSVKVSSGILTESRKQKSRKKEKLSSIKPVEPGSINELFPVGKGTTDIDKAKVTMEEVEYQRLRNIEINLKELFKAAEQAGLYVGMGKHSKLPDTREAQEGNITKKLRELVGL